VGISPTATVIGSVGRLTEQKDTRTLVHAFERIAVAHADTHLVVVGDGPRRYELEQTIIDAGLVGRVHLVGAQHDPALWYSAMDVFALSSRWEGLPRAALEAAASGLAIVSTRCGGMEELERHGIASLCAVGDDASLAGLLHRALVNLPASRITPAFLDEYSVSAMVSRTEALYDELSLLRVAS
jgi:glycosyltransferase involved in cell wall biosynthesis